MLAISRNIRPENRHHFYGETVRHGKSDALTRARDGDIQRRDFITRIRDVPGLKKFCERAMRIDQVRSKGHALGIAKIDWCTRDPYCTYGYTEASAARTARNTPEFHWIRIAKTPSWPVVFSLKTIDLGTEGRIVGKIAITARWHVFHTHLAKAAILPVGIGRRFLRAQISVL